MLSRWEASGLSVIGFCQENNINKSNFYWLKRKLKEPQKWQLVYNQAADIKESPKDLINFKEITASNYSLHFGESIKNRKS